MLAATIAAIALSAIGMSAARPFQHRLGAYTTDLEPRSPQQRRNIAEGARRLDGAVVEAGAELSFNAQVGPRTRERGFVSAPAFLEGTRLESVGGGICQVSSTLYNAALLSGLEIRMRVPHDRVVDSVPPGADATVWYGKADLVVGNLTQRPVRVHAKVAGDRLTIGFEGTELGSAVSVAAERAVLADGRVRVQVYRTDSRPGEGPRRELISDDYYRRK